MVGQNIYELRKNKKLSQEDIAEKINVTRQTISNWENGQTIPDLYQAKALAEVLNVSIDDLFEIKDTQDEKVNSNIEENENSNIESVDVSRIWNEIKLHFLDEFSQTSYELWVKPLEVAMLNGTEFILYSDEEIIANVLNNVYINYFVELIQKYYSKDIKTVKVVYKSSIDYSSIVDYEI